MPNYKRPPITEASFEIRLSDPLEDAKLQALEKRLKSRFASSEPTVDFAVGFDVKRREAITDERDHGYRLESKDRADIVLIKSRSFVCSRLAPYGGWEAFLEKCQESWGVWKRVMGARKVERIGLRYINRIDISMVYNKKIDVEDYLTVVPKYPEPDTIASFNRYTMQVVGVMESRDFDLAINTSIVPSPLVDHVSVVLDLDVFRQRDVPQSDTKIWEMANVMREHKNRVFEACVTDASRELFSK